MHDISNNRGLLLKFLNCLSVLIRSTLIIPDFLLQVIFMSRDLTRLLPFFRSDVAFGTKSLLRYVNSVNYISYWSKFWRLRRCLLIWVPLPVPTWTPYSVKVFSFLIPIVLFSIEIVIVLPFTTCTELFIYLFHFIFAFSLFTSSSFFPDFWTLNFALIYRRQLLYCCPPRMAPLIVGNIILNYLQIQ